jgi:hypothetical protein
MPPDDAGAASAVEDAGAKLSSGDELSSGDDAKLPVLPSSGAAPPLLAAPDPDETGAIAVPEELGAGVAP